MRSSSYFEFALLAATLVSSSYSISLVSAQEGSSSNASKLPVVLEKEEITNSVGIELVLIPQGSFTMGSAASNYTTPHRVTISQAFFMADTEVTRGQWQAIMGTEPWKATPLAKIEGDDLPVTLVTWKDSVDFCTKLSQKEGRVYQLPTEAQWEYACRANTQSQFSFGNDSSKLSEYAWWKGNSDPAGGLPHPVRKKKPNPLGLYDMHGNVYEWCSDWYDERYYGKSPGVDPTGPESPMEGPEGPMYFRVARGGDWFSESQFCACSARGGRFLEDIKREDIGFRVCSPYK